MGQKHLFRYTDLPSLLHILHTKSLTLLNPLTWDDKNDSSFITLYKEKSELRSTLALCFTRSSETYHHWRVFSPGSSGVRLTLDEHLLRQSAVSVPGLKMKDVEYVKIEDIRHRKPDRDRLPFLKRWPYHQESEVRLLWESAEVDQDAFSLPIEPSFVTQVTLSPWLNSRLHEHISRTIKAIDGFSSLAVRKTTLISNSEWLKHGEAAT